MLGSPLNARVGKYTCGDCAVKIFGTKSGKSVIGVNVSCGTAKL